MERDSKYYVDKGFIDVSDDAEFRIIADAASCFGKKYKGLQRSYFRHPKESNKRLWFPKLYENKEWENHISSDESFITSKSKFPERNQQDIDNINPSEDYIVIVFTREKNSSGNLMYRFKGEYQLDQNSMSYENGHVWRKIENRVKTYPNT
ncbi:MAG: hypothetical protein ABIP06_02470 [Pyrinomonadaceae bacterium]